MRAMVLLASTACDGSGPSIALSHHEELRVPDVPAPPADGPRLGAIAHTTPVRAAPVQDAKIIGYLHAGASVARTRDPYGTKGCPGGWYPIHPRGFVCLDEGATLDLRHPTLAAMAIQPNLDDPMPYAYARTKSELPVFEVDLEQPRAVRQAGTLMSKSGAAIVGAWEASDAAGTTRQLAMLTDGRFVDSGELERAEVSEFRGVELQEQIQLPVAFIVKQGISAWDISGPTLERKRFLAFHEIVPLTGRFRTNQGEQFWEGHDGSWVRHRDATVVRQRTEFPAFVHDTRRWLDVSVIAGTAVAYEGKTPVYATLVSVGKDRLGEGVENPEITERGEFAVVSKHITALNAKATGFANRVEMYDVPWVLELASGQLLHGSFWHNRFGIEHGPGNLQLSPSDARWLWGWTNPEVPRGWHAISNLPSDDTATIVNVRK